MLLVGEELGALIRPAVDDVRFGAHEHRRDDHLRPQHEAVHVEVVAEELPAPGAGRGRGAEDAEVVGLDVAHFPAVDRLAEEVVDLHAAVGLVVAGFGQAGAQEGVDGLDQVVGDFFQPHAVPGDVDFRVHPGAPLVGVDAQRLRLASAQAWPRSGDFLLLRPSQRLERFLVVAGLGQGKQIRHNIAICGDSLVRLIVKAVPMLSPVHKEGVRTS